MVARIIATLVFVVLILWDVWEAVGNLIGLPPYYAAIGFPDDIPWWILVTGLALPLMGLGVGLWWAWRHRGVAENVVMFIVILATQAALTMSVLAWEQAWRAQLLLGVIAVD